MCKQKIVLETIKKTKGRGGMTPAQVELAEAQTEDYRDMKREILKIKEDVTEITEAVMDVKAEQSYIRGQIDILVKNSSSKTGFQLCIELIRTKSFWTLATIATVLILCGKYGINPVDVVKHLFTGG